MLADREHLPLALVVLAPQSSLTHASVGCHPKVGNGSGIKLWEGARVWSGSAARCSVPDPAGRIDRWVGFPPCGAAVERITDL